MVVVGIFFIRRQLSLPVPLLPVDLLRIPLFHFLFAHLFALSAHKCWQWFPCPFTCKTVLGRSEVETGLLLTPWPLATMVMAPLAGYLIERVHAGLLGALGLFIMAAGLFPLRCCPRHLRISILSWRMALMWRWLWLIPVTQ